MEPPYVARACDGGYCRQANENAQPSRACARGYGWVRRLIRCACHRSATYPPTWTAWQRAAQVNSL